MIVDTAQVILDSRFWVAETADGLGRSSFVRTSFIVGFGRLCRTVRTSFIVRVEDGGDGSWQTTADRGLPVLDT